MSIPASESGESFPGHVWRELRELAPGDVFSFSLDGETYMVLDRVYDGVYHVVDHYFNRHRALGCTPVYLKGDTGEKTRRPAAARRASDQPPLESGMG